LFKSGFQAAIRVITPISCTPGLAAGFCRRSEENAGNFASSSIRFVVASSRRRRDAPLDRPGSTRGATLEAGGASGRSCCDRLTGLIAGCCYRRYLLSYVRHGLARPQRTSGPTSSRTSDSASAIFASIRCGGNSVRAHSVLKRRAPRNERCAFSTSNG
jgi:hypothetical protein